MPLWSREFHKEDDMSEMWEQGLDPHQAEVHEPVVRDEDLWAHEMSDKPEQPAEELTVSMPWTTRIEFTDEFPNTSLDDEMAFLVDNVSWADEEAMERIFRATVLLKVKFPDRSLGHCLAQAIMWECG